MAKKLYPTHFILLMLILMAGLHLLWPVIRLLPVPWNLFGVIPLAFGIGINLAADAALGNVGTTVKPGKESTALVTAGAYRISRNPMYFGFALILAGIAWMLGSLTPWIVLLLFAIVMDRMFIAAEERKLAARFGTAWKDYAAKVRRWI